MTASPTVPVFWRFDRWPEADRAAWIRDISPGDPFDDPHYGNTLAEETLKKTRKGYGRWLSFLASRGWFNPDEPALARVTRPRLRAYFRTLLKAGYASATIISLFSDLERALRILAPGNDVAWVRKPDGATIHSLLRKTQRVLVVPHSDVLFAWGLDMMDDAASQSLKSAHLTAYRDGLLIAVFAARGRRLRSMSLLRVDQELRRYEHLFRIQLTPGQVKTRKHDRFNLPAPLTPYVLRYLEVVRPALLRGRSCDAVWITKGGGKLSPSGIQARMLKLSKQRFGTAFGPHRFRHAIGTTAPLRDPANPGVAAGMLGISKEVLEWHYNRAGQSQATTAFAKLIDQKRRDRRNTSQTYSV
jgi:hypothetical protein